MQIAQLQSALNKLESFMQHSFIADKHQVVHVSKVELFSDIAFDLKCSLLMVFFYLC